MWDKKWNWIQFQWNIGTHYGWISIPSLSLRLLPVFLHLSLHAERYGKKIVYSNSDITTTWSLKKFKELIQLTFLNSTRTQLLVQFDFLKARAVITQNKRESWQNMQKIFYDKFTYLWLPGTSAPLVFRCLFCIFSLQLLFSIILFFMKVLQNIKPKCTEKKEAAELPSPNSYQGEQREKLGGEKKHIC